MAIANDYSDWQELCHLNRSMMMAMQRIVEDIDASHMHDYVSLNNQSETLNCVDRQQRHDITNDLFGRQCEKHNRLSAATFLHRLYQIDSVHSMFLHRHLYSMSIDTIDILSDGKVSVMFFLNSKTRKCIDE